MTIEINPPHIVEVVETLNTITTTGENLVEVNESTNEITVTQGNTVEVSEIVQTITVQDQRKIIEITSNGPQGIQGPAGADGIVDYSLALAVDQTTPQYITNGSPVGLAQPTFTYSLGALTRIDYPSGFFKAFSYNPDGSLAGINLNNQHAKTFSYNLDGSLSGIITT